jgi:predicted acylesterase/phospholipase RssA
MSETKPLPPCDAIFRGGITSGVVYPGFVAKLADSYRFARVGGASAGAIAAGLTAAVEYGRSTGAVPDAFEKLKATERDVAGGAGAVTSLAKLFQPTPELAGAHALLMRGMWLLGAGWRWKAAAALTALLLLGLLVSLPGLLAWLIVLGLAAALWFGRKALLALAAQGFGMCGGTRPDLAQDMETLRREGALADWLHAEIQRLSGRTVGRVPAGVLTGEVPAVDRPLTMGDLWGPGPGREIDLLLTTTNLTQQLAHQFPFLEKTRNRLFFRRDTLARVLPPDVVAWMEHRARTPEAAWPRAEPGFLWLPDPADLPVLLGVRMSLSFPGLIAAVPLYAHDHDVPIGPENRFAPRRLWFSDGGITSNFPITLFDAPLPRHPTFCITLREATPVEAAAPPRPAKPGVSTSPLVVMANANADGTAPRFLTTGDETLGGFLASIVQTARNAQENELMLQPGQRDRIVHVLTKAGEGGLNLAMPAEVITALSGRGAEAARVLLARFPAEGAAEPGIALDWRNHRWVRLRATMAALERVLARLADGAAAAQPPGCDVMALIQDPPDYLWAKDPALAAERARAAAEAMERLTALAAAMRAEAERLAALAPEGMGASSVFDALRGEQGAPEPRNALVARPLPLDPRETAIYR